MNDTQEADPLAEIFEEFDPFEAEQPVDDSYSAWDEAQRSMAALAYTLLVAVVGAMVGAALVLHWLVRVLVR